MKKKLLVLVLSAVMAVGMMSGCGAKSDTSDTKAKTAESSSAKEEETEEQTECELEDGTYTAEFKTDSGMFHVNEANDGCGTLTVKSMSAWFLRRSSTCLKEHPKMHRKMVQNFWNLQQIR